MSKVVIVGAGKTGRGFLARLLRDQEIVLIDKNSELIEALNTEKKFNVDFFGGKKPSLSIEFSAARTWETVEASDFEEAEVILVSVGGTNLVDVGAELKNIIDGARKICSDYPTVSGDTDKRPYISNECYSMLERADKEREAFSDEYLSVEHLLLAILKTKNSKIKRLFSENSINREAVLSALKRNDGLSE